MVARKQSRSRKGKAQQDAPPILSGEWHAVWQTTVEGKENINGERITITRRGDKFLIKNVEKSADNPKGGYLWRGELALHDNRILMGCYEATDRTVTSKGTLYLLLNRVGNFMEGMWVGCNYDYDFTWGRAVIAKESDVAWERMITLKKLRRGLKHGQTRESTSKKEGQ